MKHIVIACAVLSACLGFCIYSSAAVTEQIDRAIEELDKAQGFAMQEDFEQAQNTVSRAMQLWIENEKLFGIMLRHSETDDVLCRFSALRQYAQLEDRDDFSAYCAELTQMLSHLRSMQKCSIENVL